MLSALQSKPTRASSRTGDPVTMFNHRRFAKRASRGPWPEKRLDSSAAWDGRTLTPNILVWNMCGAAEAERLMQHNSVAGVAATGVTAVAVRPWNMPSGVRVVLIAPPVTSLRMACLYSSEAIIRGAPCGEMGVLEPTNVPRSCD